MKLGACYNVFDSEELLESSILSIKEEVEYICVVYQTVSNFGNSCHRHLEELLKDLVTRGLVNDIVHYEPKQFTAGEKAELTTSTATSATLGGPVESVSDVFYNEMTKREIGRRRCMENGCTHFMSMDADEYYLREQLRFAKEVVEECNYDGTACRMRTFFKEPIYELLPPDEMNAVPFIYKIHPDFPFKLVADVPVLLDPTRRLDHLHTFHVFDRSDVEMCHMSLVRKDMRMKMANVSNKGNYAAVDAFLKDFETWNPSKGVIHPHPNIGRQFTTVATVPNYFKINLETICSTCYKTGSTKKCTRCLKEVYCSKECQVEDWPNHKLKCNK